MIGVMAFWGLIAVFVYFTVRAIVKSPPADPRSFEDCGFEWWIKDPRRSGYVVLTCSLPNHHEYRFHEARHDGVTFSYLDLDRRR